MMDAEGAASAGIPIQSNPAASSPPTFDSLQHTPPASTQPSQYDVPKIRLRTESAPSFRPVSPYSASPTTRSNAAGGGAKVDAGHRFMSAGVQCPHYRDAYSCPSSPAQRPIGGPEDVTLSCPVSPLLSPTPNGPTNLNSIESQPFELPPSTSKEWQRRNRFDKEDNEVLDELMQYDGLDNIEQRLLDITAKVDISKTQGRDSSSEKSNVIVNDVPETGETNVTRHHARLLHTSRVIESDDVMAASGMDMVKRGMQAVKSVLRKMVFKSTVLFNKCNLPVLVSVKDKTASARRARPFANSEYRKNLRRRRMLNECETQPPVTASLDNCGLMPCLLTSGGDGGPAEDASASRDELPTVRRGIRGK